MGKCLVTKFNASVELVNNFKLLGYASSFDADSEKNAVFGIDHARVKVFGTSEPCQNYSTKEVLGTEFSVQDDTQVQFPCGDGVKVFLDLRDSINVFSGGSASKYFKNFHLEKVHKAEYCFLSMRGNSLNIDNVFDGTLELDTILNPQVAGEIHVTSQKVGGVKVKINVNNFKVLRFLRVGSNVNAEISLNLDSIPESLLYIELFSITYPINGVTGSINSITKTNMRRIQVVGATNVTGSLEKVVEGMWTKGRRSGDCPILIKRTSATFHGNVPDFDTTAKFDNSGVTIYRSDKSQGEVVATYNGTSWSYN